MTESKHIDNFHINNNLLEIISSQSDRYAPMIGEIKHISADAFSEISISTDDDSLDPQWRQGFFTWLDALSICAALKLRNPKNYVEIGSGNSTRFARWCIRKYNLRTQIISIDPEPRRDISLISDQVHITPVQHAPIKIFEDMEESDILFYDGSHDLGPFTDMSHIAYTVMPNLPKGVMIAMHDTYLPFLAQNMEDYLLGAILTGGNRYKIDFPAHYVASVNEAMRADLLKVLQSNRGQDVKANHYSVFEQHGKNLHTDMHGCTFFMS